MVDLEISFCCLIIYLVEWDFFLFYSVVWVSSGSGLCYLFISTGLCRFDLSSKFFVGALQ